MPGIFLLAGTGLQLPAGSLVISIGDDGKPSMEVKQTLVRLDLWLTWLEIGCIQTACAVRASARLAPDLPDSDKYAALTEELQSGLVAITAFAFAIDGFYDTVKQELGAHPDQATWKKKRTSRHAQVTETLRYHLKLGPTLSSQLRTVLKQLFEFRSRGVHPDSTFIAPNYRPQIDAGVHPHLITFSGAHAVQCRALTLELLDRLILRAADLRQEGADKGWIERGKKEVDRLAKQYRTPGDDQLAFAAASPLVNP